MERRVDRYNMPIYREKGNVSKMGLSHQTITKQTKGSGKSIQRSLENRTTNFKFKIFGNG